jgi:hypothetical protein
MREIPDPGSGEGALTFSARPTTTITQESFHNADH